MLEPRGEGNCPLPSSAARPCPPAGGRRGGRAAHCCPHVWRVLLAGGATGAGAWRPPGTHSGQMTAPPCAQQAGGARDYQSWSLLAHPRGVCTYLQKHALRAGCRLLPAGAARSATQLSRFCRTVAGELKRHLPPRSRCVCAMWTWKERSLTGRTS